MSKKNMHTLAQIVGAIALAVGLYILAGLAITLLVIGASLLVASVAAEIVGSK